MDVALPHLKKLQSEADHPELWQDPKAAEILLREKTQLEKRIGGFQALEGEYNDLIDMLELAESEGETDLIADCEQKPGNAAAKIGGSRFGIAVIGRGGWQ